MKEYQEEYEIYMKKVVDNFMSMQTESITYNSDKTKMSQMVIVEWNGGLEWSAIKAGEMFRDGNLMDENRKYNSEIAKQYLKHNAITYDEWMVKYNNNVKTIQ